MKQRDRLSLQSLFRPLSVLLLQLLLTHFCKGESQLIGPPHSIVAAVGDDIILPCHLKPEKDITTETLEWKRFNLKQRFVHVRRDGQDLENVKNPSYRGRTSLFTDELKRGNISLKLSKVQLSDQGIYECDLPLLGKQSSLKLVVASGAVPPPVISLSGIDRESGGVILNCVSKSWYPEPEVLWLDGEGKLLSAGPTETVRGPDDLYTVSSRVTVEKRHSNSFTCRVQQNNINQTKTEIYIPDDFFKVQFTYSSITTGLAVSLVVCILLILFLSFLAWKRKQIIKTKRSHSDETDEGERRNHSETKRIEDQFATEEEVTALKRKEEKQSKHSKWRPVSRQRFQAERQRKEDTENKVQILEEELQTKTKELQDEHTRRGEAERELQMKEQELQNKTSELEGNQAETIRLLQQETQEKDKAQREVETLKNQLESKTTELQDEKKKKKEFEEKVETMKEELQNKNTQLEGKQDDIIKQLLQETQEKEKAQMEVETLKNQLEIQKKQAAETKRQLDTKTCEWKKLQTELQDEKKKNMLELEKEMKTLKQELQNKNTQLQDEQTRREEAERQVKRKQQKPQNKTAELQDEKKRRMGSEEKVKTSQKELKNKNTEVEKNKPEPASSKTQPQQQNSCLIS